MKRKIFKKKIQERKIQEDLLSKLIFEITKEANKNIRTKTKGHANLNSMIFVGLLLWGIEELIRNPVMPKWYDIMRAAQSAFYDIGRKYGGRDSKRL